MGMGKGERKRGRETSMCGCFLPTRPYLACNPDMCPDRESNQQPFGSQPFGTQSTEPHQQGPKGLNRKYNSHASRVNATECNGMNMREKKGIAEAAKKQGVHPRKKGLPCSSYQVFPRRKVARGCKSFYLFERPNNPDC